MNTSSKTGSPSPTRWVRIVCLAALLLLAPCVTAESGWFLETDEADWPARRNFASVVFNNRIWVMGGFVGGGVGSNNDVWSSEDGVNWTEHTPQGPIWDRRESPQAVVFDDGGGERIWLMGGRARDDDGNFYAATDVWTSADGENWTLVTSAAAPLTDGRGLFRLAVYDSGNGPRIWLTGGDAGDQYKKDVWSSADGQNWTLVNANADWPARNRHGMIAFQDRLWVLGGFNGNFLRDIWSSANGVTWTDHTPPASDVTAGKAWGARRDFGLAVFHGRLCILGGNGNNNNEVWSTADGEHWRRQTPAEPMWSPRDRHQAVVHDDGDGERLWVLGGLLTVSDVWSTGGLPPTLGTPVTEAVPGQLYTYEIDAGGFPASIIEVDWLPDWLSLDGYTLSGTPEEEDFGLTDPITITADNGVGQTFQFFSINVIGTPPEILSDPPVTVTMGYLYQVIVGGVPKPTLSAGVLPGWLQFNPETGILSGMPGDDDLGLSDTITITAQSNGWGPDFVQGFQIEVLPWGPVTFGWNPMTQAEVFQPYSYMLPVHGNPTPTYVVDLPEWLELDPVTRELHGTPGAAHVGESVVKITAQGGLDDIVLDFYIMVAGIPPEITSTPDSSAEIGALFSYTITATGTPAPFFEVAGHPEWLSLSGNVLSGIPTEIDHLGWTDEITITALNGEEPSDTQVFQIFVSGTAPVIVSDPETQVRSGEDYYYMVAATGAPTPILSVASPLPPWLEFDPVSGVLSGRPVVLVNISVDVAIVASNGVAPDSIQAFTIDVAISGDKKSDDGGGCALRPGSGQALRHGSGGAAASGRTSVGFVLLLLIPAAVRARKLNRRDSPGRRPFLRGQARVDMTIIKLFVSFVVYSFSRLSLKRM